MLGRAEPVRVRGEEPRRGGLMLRGAGLTSFLAGLTAVGLMGEGEIDGEMAMEGVARVMAGGGGGGEGSVDGGGSRNDTFLAGLTAAGLTGESEIDEEMAMEEVARAMVGGGGGSEGSVDGGGSDGDGDEYLPLPMVRVAAGLVAARLVSRVMVKGGVEGVTTVAGGLQLGVGRVRPSGAELKRG